MPSPSQPVAVQQEPTGRAPRGRSPSSRCCRWPPSWPASTCSSSTWPARHRPRLPRSLARRSELGPQRLRDRVRRAARAPRPARRPLRAQGRLPARAGRLHAREHRLRGQWLPRAARGFRVLQAVGAAALTPTSLGLLLTATPPAGRVRAVRIWAASGALAAAAGPGAGRRPGGGVLALGVPDQRPHRPRRAGLGGAVVPASRDDQRTRGARPARRRDPRRRHRRAGAGPGEGPRLGVDQRRRCSAASPSPSPGGVVLAALAAPPRAGDRARAAAGAQLRLRQRHGAAVHRRVRREPAGRRPVDAAGVGLLGRAHRTRHRRRAADGADRSPPSASGRRAGCPAGLDHRGRLPAVRARHLAGRDPPRPRAVLRHRLLPG